MPFGDGTGPDGRGSFTGRGVGYCAGNDRPGCYEPGFGYGRGRGMGFGRGRGFGRGYGRFSNFNAYRAPYTPYQQNEPVAGEFDNLEALKQQQSWLKTQLEGISKRIDELVSTKENK